MVFKENASVPINLSSFEIRFAFLLVNRMKFSCYNLASNGLRKASGFNLFDGLAIIVPSFLFLLYIFVVYNLFVLNLNIINNRVYKNYMY